MPERIILIDADVVSHFITAGEASAIHLIFPQHKIHMLDKVHAELQNWKVPQMMQTLSDLLSKKHIRLMEFPEENEVIKREYFYIKNKLFKGDGESACMAVARYSNNILASSNLTDIKNYCSMHRIDYLTTMDFICEAHATGLFSEARCNAFIGKVLASGSKLPAKTFSAATCRNLAFLSQASSR